MCVLLISSCLFTSTVLKEINNLPRLPRIFIGNWAAACYNCGWIYPAAGYKLQLSRAPAAGYKLQMSPVPAAGYKLQLTPSYGWLKFRWLDTSYSWFYPAANSSSGSSIRVAVDSVTQVTWVPTAGYELQLRHPTADSSSAGWIRFKADSMLQLTTSCGLDSTCGWPIL